jgi:mannose-6-phosphate isomerase-like protein (cupin superfamily)
MGALSKENLDHLNHWSPAALLERAAVLREQAELGDGAASITLQEFPRHCAMLLVRTGNGLAEVHENFADLFYVLDGSAALVTGGVVAGAASIGPGETRGSSVEGGARQQLRAGDVAHVPAGLPHQMVVAAGQTITCLVMKIQEKP